MTATDSSPLEPDTRTSAAASAQHGNAIGAAGIKTSQQAAKEDVSDGSATTDDKPRATRVAEGAWLGGVCTGLARHLGWPLMAVRIAWFSSHAATG